MTHSPAIYSRIAQLEPYAPGLLAVVERWLPVIEPHLDDILERLDDIEPHLPYVIENIDVLAPQCGTALHPRPSPHPRILSLLTVGPTAPRPTVITSSNRTPLPPPPSRPAPSTAPGALLRHLDALLLYAEDEAWLPGVTP